MNMTIKWLDPVTVSGVTFRKGDNGEQLFYDAEANGIRWTVIRPHIRNPVMPGVTPPKDGFCHVPYWSACVEDAGGAVKLLNSATVGHDRQLRDVGPLHDATDSGYVDPPTRLLEGVAGMIADGTNPWA
jgi:hypothetical protein